MDASAASFAPTPPFNERLGVGRANERQDVRHFPGASISRVVIPVAGAFVGGDWCEAFLISEGLLALSIGDVCGHGLSAYGMMQRVRRTVRESLEPGADPARALRDANYMLCEEDGEVYATAVVGLLDTRSGAFAFANAGHPPPLLARPAGSVFLTTGQGDFPLGIDVDAVPAVQTLSVPVESLLVLYSDGLVDTRDDLVANDRLRLAALAAYRQAGHGAAGEIQRRVLAKPNADDVAILATYFHGSEGAGGRRNSVPRAKVPSRPRQRSVPRAQAD